MRQLPAVVAISAAVHAGLVVWVSTREHQLAAQDRDVAPRIELVAPAPVEVTLVVPPPVDEAPDDVPAPAPEPARAAATAASAERRADEPSPRGAAISSSAAGSTAPLAPAEPGTPGDSRATQPVMSMRKGRPPRLVAGVPTGSWDGSEEPAIDDRGGAETGWLVPDGGGSYRSDLGAVTAKIERDGSVTLKDKRNLNVRFAVPGAKDMGRALARWYEDDRKSGGPAQPARPNDAPAGQDKKPDHGQTVPIVGGSFDLTDAMMRRQGFDPYASQKLAYLDATRDERVRIGRRHRAEQLERAPEIAQKNLERAIHAAPDPRALRRSLFELWDECAEPGPDVPDAIVVAGREARALVIGYIRARLPAGSPDAYSEHELVKLNRGRSSRAVFAPYE